MPADDRDRAARLLLKALEPLPKRDRELVLRTLLTGRMPTGPVGRRRLGSLGGPMRVPEPAIGLRTGRQADQPLLVRLPTALHERLRHWSTAHGFSMAAVVRGLVERFLDDQEGTGRGRP